MTRESFDLELGRLAVLPGMPGDSDGYWEVLQDIPDDVMTSAIGHALKTRKWFPVPVELRQDADSVKPRTFYQPRHVKPSKTVEVFIPNPFGGKGITLQVAEESNYECAACFDQGWESVWCGGPAPSRKFWQDSAVCTRSGVHTPHEWARKCSCWNTNTVLIQRREVQATYAAQREQKR